jgi:hypothetical protein
MSSHLSVGGPLSLCSRGSFPLDPAVLLSRVPFWPVRSVIRLALIPSLSRTFLRRVCVLCTFAMLLNTALVFMALWCYVISPTVIRQANITYLLPLSLCNFAVLLNTALVFMA